MSVIGELGNSSNDGMLAFRLDASFAIGHGHLSRCTMLARALQERGWEIHFLLAMPVSELEDISKNFPAYVFHALPTFADEIEDAAHSMLILKKLQPKWVIVDHYGLGLIWEREIGRFFALAAIDDLDRAHFASVILDQNLGVRHYSENHSEKKARLLLGPRYALIASDFLKYRKCESFLSAQESIKVAVTFGTYDQKKSSDLVIKALREFSGLELTFFCGRDEALLSRATKWSDDHANVHVLGFQHDMARQLSKFDVVIGAGGVSALERLCLGVPSVLVATADNQVEVSESLAKVGAVMYLGLREALTPDCIALALGVLKTQPWLGVSLREKGFSLVDGQGLLRVVAAFDPPYALRKAGPEDLLSVYRWRNSPENQRFSIQTQGEISIENHTIWFNKCLGNPQQHLLIAEDEKAPVGVLRLDVDHTEATVSIYLLPGLKGQQRGQRCLRALELYAHQNLPSVKSFLAEIQEGNTASIKCFEACGYKLSKRCYTLTLITPAPHG